MWLDSVLIIEDSTFIFNYKCKNIYLNIVLHSAYDCWLLVLLQNHKMLNISLRQRRQRQNWQENLHLHQFKRDKMMETSVSTSILLPSLVPVVNKTGSANISSPALFIFPKKICCLNVLLIQVFSEVQSHWTFPLSYIYMLCQWHYPLTLSVYVWCVLPSGFAHWLWHVNCYANLYFGTPCLWIFFTFESNFMGVFYHVMQIIPSRCDPWFLMPSQQLRPYQDCFKQFQLTMI